MINFEEELKKFHPSLEIEEAEDAIYNQDLTDMGKTFNLGKKLNNNIQQTANDNPNDKMLSNMANDENMTANCAYTRNNRLEHMKHDDPERYKRINGERLQKVIQDKLDNAKGISKSHGA